MPPDPARIRTPADDAALPESRGGLWRLTAGPAIWALHFLLSYVTAAIHCAKAPVAAAPLGGVRVALWTYTALALAAIAYAGWRGWRQHRFGASQLPHDEATAGDRHRFL